MLSIVQTIFNNTLDDVIVVVVVVKQALLNLKVIELLNGYCTFISCELPIV